MYKTKQHVSINTGENIDNKILKVTKASNTKTRETDILIYKPNSQNFIDFKRCKHENL